ncbi:hypothetical protein JC862_09980 [Morganella morganii]|nr:hypothetical protein [Morganella morganii]QXO44770.1 hypothetical protein JC862_09980 [Morganella morganii]
MEVIYHTGGDFSETLLLFPFMREFFLDGHKKSFLIVSDQTSKTYRLFGANNIHLIVNYERDMMSYWTDIKEKKEETEQSLLIRMVKKNENQKAIPIIKNC